MPDPAQLAKDAALLDESQWREFVDAVWQFRRHTKPPADEEPPSHASRDDVAGWVARQHLSTDPGVTDVWYLPEQAPTDEIRLMEVNALLQGLDEDEVSAVDFGMDVGGLSFKLLVADVTPGQMELISRGQLATPAGWVLKGARRFTRAGA